MIYDVNVRRMELCALFDMKAKRSDLLNWLPNVLTPLPEKPNTSKTTDEFMMYWIGPEHWILRSSLERESDLASLLDLSTAPDGISVTLISDTLNFFSLAGNEVDEIISIASPLDIQPNKFPQNGVTFTEAFGLRTLLVRTSVGFELGIDQSYADLMEDYLTRAGVSFD